MNRPKLTKGMHVDETGNKLVVVQEHPFMRVTVEYTVPYHFSGEDVPNDPDCARNTYSHNGVHLRVRKHRHEAIGAAIDLLQQARQHNADEAVQPHKRLRELDREGHHHPVLDQLPLSMIAAMYDTDDELPGPCQGPLHPKPVIPAPTRTRPRLWDGSSAWDRDE
jgi:hypothetical protein